MEKIKIIPAFRFLLDVVKLVNSGYKGVIEISLDGGRHSAKTFSAMLMVCLFLYSPLKVDVILGRETPSGATQSFKQFAEIAMQAYNFHPKNFNKTYKTFKANNSQLRAIGYTTNRKRKVGKIGLARVIKPDLAIGLFDEISEFSTYEPEQYIYQAQGGAPTLIKVRTKNPFSPYHWSNEDIMKFHPYNEAKLRKYGFDTKMAWITPTHLKISSHSNHRANPTLSEAQHQELLKLWDVDPFMARTADLGLPGIERGAAYPQQTLSKIQHPRYGRKWAVERYKCGVDWGESTHIGGSATSSHLIRIGLAHQWVSVDEEYYHSNSTNKQYKDTGTLIREIINKWNAIIDDPKYFGDIKAKGGITINVDNAATGIIKGLRDYALTTRNGYLMNIQASYKYPREKRLRASKLIMAQYRFYVNQTKCPMYWAELNMAMLDEERQHIEEVRVKEKDDTLDDVEYAIGTDLMKLCDKKTYELLYKRL